MISKKVILFNSNKLFFNKYYCTLNKRPLSGFKVLDLSRVLAGPWCSQLLGDLGADVIKVEHVEKGDDTREWGPPFYRDLNGNINTAYFSCTNRNKKSIAIDISKSQGQEILHNLVKESDVVIENFKVGGLKKYRLDYDYLSKLNDKLVYCSITGFGQTGPMKSLPGYDFAIQAMGGLMSITGDAENPYKCGVAIVDIMTGLYANTAIQAALHWRNQTGKGQYIDISLLDVQSAFLANQASSHLVTGKNPKRIGNSHPSISPYDSLKTKDGFIVVAVGNNSQFHSLCNSLDIGHLSSDSKYSSNSSRVEHRESLLKHLNEKTINFTTQELEDLFARGNIPCSPINTLDKVYSSDQIKSRSMIWDIPFKKSNSNSLDKVESSTPCYDLDSIKVVGNPIHFSETNLHTPESIKSNLPPPNLGEHTDQVLISLGYTENQIKDLKDNKVIKSE